MLQTLFRVRPDTLLALFARSSLEYGKGNIFFHCPLAFFKFALRLMECTWIDWIEKDLPIVSRFRSSLVFQKSGSSTNHGTSRSSSDSYGTATTKRRTINQSARHESDCEDLAVRIVYLDRVKKKEIAVSIGFKISFQQILFLSLICLFSFFKKKRPLLSNKFREHRLYRRLKYIYLHVIFLFNQSERLRKFRKNGNFTTNAYSCYSKWIADSM